MSRWGNAFRIVVAAVVGAFIGGPGTAWMMALSQASQEHQRKKRDRQNREALQAYNASLKDRLEMIDVQPDIPRSLCLGRVRGVEGVRRRWQSGTNSEYLTLIVSYAGHEVDAFEDWYINDSPVTLDGSGYVQEEPWLGGVSVAYSQTGTLDGSGGASVTLDHTPDGAVTAVYIVGVSPNEDASLTVSGTGTSRTLSGGAAGATYRVNFTYAADSHFVRIRTYSGTSTQNVGAALAAEYPGLITATDSFAGIALAVIDLLYSPDVFPQGVPNINCVFRGARCYDPRLDSTVTGGSGAHRFDDPSTWEWTKNPALHALRYAMWDGGLRLTSASSINMQDVQAAATQCDVSTDFDLRMPDNTVTTVTMARHESGIMISSAADRRQSMDSIVEAMAGEWCFAGGVLRMRAGKMASSVATIDSSWIVQVTDENGDVDGTPPVTASQSYPREQRFNLVSGRCIDQSERFQLLPYPAVRDAVLISQKGERRYELDLEAVTHHAHAQHLASIAIRRAQAGMHMQLTCGPQAETLEVFDVVTLTLADYGIVDKTFEVVGVAIGDEATTLMLREITDALWTVDSELTGRDPAPDSSLIQPWDFAAPTSVAVTSGTTDVTDLSSVLTRTKVTWAAITDGRVLRGGQIEVQYTLADEAMPAGDWPSWFEQGHVPYAVIPGLQTQRAYLFRVRVSVPMLGQFIRGPWSVLVQHIVSAAPQSGTDTAFDSGSGSTTHVSTTSDTADIATLSYTNTSGRTLVVHFDAGISQVYFYSGSLFTTAKAEVVVSGAVADNGTFTIREYDPPLTAAEEAIVNYTTTFERSLDDGDTLSITLRWNATTSATDAVAAMNGTGNLRLAAYKTVS